MTDISATQPSPTPDVGTVRMSVIPEILRLGWRDFTRAPLMGLFFAAFYVIGGLILYFQLRHADQSYSIIPVALGFPLLAPFLAVGLYELSHRLERGDKTIPWGEVLGVVFRQKDRQIPSMAVVIIMIFLFWVFIAHMIFALFLGLMPMTNILSDWQHTIFSFNGIKMLAVGSLVGAATAYALFSLTVVSLPLLLDKELDFITAMIVSWKFVAANRAVMLVWGVLIAVLLFVAMIPAFLGLFIVMPVLGHATWHLYRRALVHPE